MIHHRHPCWKSSPKDETNDCVIEMLMALWWSCQGVDDAATRKELENSKRSNIPQPWSTSMKFTGHRSIMMLVGNWVLTCLDSVCVQRFYCPIYTRAYTHFQNLHHIKPTKRCETRWSGAAPHRAHPTCRLGRRVRLDLSCVRHVSTSHHCSFDDGSSFLLGNLSMSPRPKRIFWLVKAALWSPSQSPKLVNLFNRRRWLIHLPSHMIRPRSKTLSIRREYSKKSQLKFEKDDHSSACSSCRLTTLSYVWRRWKYI